MNLKKKMKKYILRNRMSEFCEQKLGKIDKKGFLKTKTIKIY